MKYELILQGDKKLVVEDLVGKQILKAVSDKKEIIEIGDLRFKYTMFKGLFPLKEDFIMDKSAWIKENQEWHDTCLRMSKYPLEKKIEIEMDNRIVPGLTLNNIDLPIQLFEPMKHNIKHFFEQNEKYPRCPMRIWWPFIRAFIAPLDKETKTRKTEFLVQNKWWEYIMRNDDAIGEWLKYN